MKLSKQAMALSLALALSVSVFYACGESTTTETGQQEGVQTEEQARTESTSPGTDTGQTDSGMATGETAQNPGTGTDSGTTTN